ncbi:MAG: tetratricopeptide repeat protein [Opitutae bacterium]|nr:tetratricopeptide repeat protein [Opitutae bacterium]
MPDVTLGSLDPRYQKLVENAHIALDRGNLDYVVEVCGQVLKAVPGCLVARRLLRMAHLRQYRAKNRFMAKAFSSVSSAGFLFGSGRKEPAKALAQAEKMLAGDPTSVPALRMLAEAALALGMPETAAFAFEAIREYEPENRANLIALGEAWFAAGKMPEALKAADEVLQRSPADGDAQNLMRKVTISQATTQGKWDDKGNYREKLRDEQQAVSLEQSAKIVTAEEMAQRLIRETLERINAEPTNVTHYRTLVQNYRQLGDTDSALEWVRKARQQPAGRTDAALEKVEAELQVAVLEKQLLAAQAAAANVPADAALAARVKEAQAALDSFQLHEAKSFVERYPNDFTARCNYGEILLRAGQVDAAAAQFQQAQKNPQVRLPALIGLGRCFKTKTLYDLAATQLLAAKSEQAEMNEAKKEAIYLLGECYAAMGKTEAAIAEFKLIYAEDIGYRDVAEKINAHYAAAR